MGRASIWRNRVAIAVFCLTPGWALAAETAFVAKVGGSNAMVVRGDKVIPLRAQMPLAPSDRLVAGSESSVVVRYIADGCVVKVASGKSLVVAETSPCAPKSEPKSEKTVNNEPQATPETPAAKVVPAAAGSAVAKVIDMTGRKNKINSGKGLVALRSGTKLNDGDIVFAGAESTITLYFENEPCQFVVEPDSSLSISSVEPPCRAVAQSANSKELNLPGVIPPVVGPVPSMVSGGMLLGAGAVTIMGFRGEGDPVTP